MLVGNKIQSIAINDDNLLLNRPFSSNGLPDGSLNMNADGSETPVEYYVEALEGEKLLIARVMIHIVDEGKFDSGYYGSGITITNGIQIFYKRNGFKLDVTKDLKIKTNVDWGRWCFDVTISSFGSGNEALDARWTFLRYGNPYGVMLNEGDQLGIIINDDLSGLVEQTIIAEGVHLGIPSATWTTVLT